MRADLATLPDPDAPPVWVLSGQSNAVGLTPFLAPYATVRSAAQGSVPIAAWAPDQPLWTLLEAALLAGPFTTFIWWQGENNTDHPELYATALDDLIRRVQAVTGRRTRLLPVVICGVSDVPGYEPFRAMQAQYAAERGFYFVRSDDIVPHPAIGDPDPPSGGTWAGPGASPHLTIAGYTTMASRIAALLLAGPS